MTKNPLINALCATAYIVIVALFMFYGTKMLGESGKPDNVLAPIAMLSLFVLSASVMGFIFLSQPLRMFLDGKKDEAVSLFVKTVATFAVFTLLVFTYLFLAR